MARHWSREFGTDGNGSFRDHLGGGLFRNLTYTPTTVSFQKLKALAGDADGDKDVDITDFNSLAGNFDPGGANSATNDWTKADFDADGDIDITDFSLLAGNFAPRRAMTPARMPSPSRRAWCCWPRVAWGYSFGVVDTEHFTCLASAPLNDGLADRACPCDFGA